MIRRLATLSLVVALVLVAWGTYVAFFLKGELSELVVDEPIKNVGQQAVGQHTISVRLRNASTDILHVTVPPGGCGETACLISGNSERAMTLGSRETASLDLNLIVRKAGPFSAQLRLLAWGSRTESLTVTVEGVGVESAGGDIDHSTP